MSRVRLSRLLAAVLSGCSALLVPTGPARAQEPSQLVEGIVAVVGDTIITFLELQETAIQIEQQMRAAGMKLPETPQEKREFYKQALDQKINETLLVLYAQREGIVVGEDEVQQAVEQQLAQIRRQFQSEMEFQQALIRRGTTAPEFRMSLAEQARASIMGQRYLQSQVSQFQPTPISEEEIRQAFEEQKSRFGTKPATVSIKQVVIPVKPTEEALLAAKRETEEVLSRARSGEDFAKLAREYSDDAASRAGGGELGWVSKGALLPSFEKVLFSMRPGQISDVVETQFGYHIIKLDRVRGNERLASHILIMPALTEADEQRARLLSDSVAAALKAGADIDSLIQKYGDPDERSSLTDFPQDRLPDSFKAAIAGAKPGDLIGPIKLAVPGLPGKWVVGRLIEVSPGGTWTLDDVRESIRQQLQQQQMIQKVVQRLREQTYIEVRLDEFAGILG